MMRLKFWALLMTLYVTLFVVTWYAYPVRAEEQMQCGDHAKISAGLLAKYGESPLMMGVGGTGEIFEVFGNPTTGTWTIITTDAEVSCLRAAGKHMVLPPMPKPGVPS